MIELGDECLQPYGVATVGARYRKAASRPTRHILPGGTAAMFMGLLDETLRSSLGDR